MTKRPESAGWGARAASGVIVLVLGLQALTAFGLTPGPIEHSPYLWPFLEYPMYSKAHFVGEEVPRYQVVAVTGAGGVLCGEMARALSDVGAKVAVLDIREAAAEEVGLRCQVAQAGSRAEG